MSFSTHVKLRLDAAAVFDLGYKKKKKTFKYAKQQKDSSELQQSAHLRTKSYDNRFICFLHHSRALPPPPPKRRPLLRQRTPNPEKKTSPVPDMHYPVSAKKTKKASPIPRSPPQTRVRIPDFDDIVISPLFIRYLRTRRPSALGPDASAVGKRQPRPHRRDSRKKEKKKNCPISFFHNFFGRAGAAATFIFPEGSWLRKSYFCSMGNCEGKSSV